MQMKISVTTLGTFGAISPQDLMPKLAQWGYDGIELWGGDLPGAEHVKWYQDNSVRIKDVFKGDRAGDEEMAQIEGLKSLADKNGLAIPMISTYFDFIADRQRWEDSLIIGQRYIDYARALNCPLIRALTGGWGSGLDPKEAKVHVAGKEVPSVDMTDEQWDSLISGLRQLTSLPGAQDVIFAFETHKGRPEDSIESLKREITEPGASNLKILLQPDQMIPRNPGLTLKTLLDELYDDTVHFHMRTGMKDVADIDYTWLLSELGKRGYSGFITLEGIKEPKLKSIEEEIKWFRQVTGD